MNTSLSIDLTQVGETWQYPGSQPKTSELIFRVADLVRNHIFLQDTKQPLFTAIWVLGTYMHEVFDYYGYLWLVSPTKRCGKSKFEDLLSTVCYNATSRIYSPTEATIFHLANNGETVILDEMEHIGKSDRKKYAAIIGIINSAFQSGGTVRRMIKGQAVPFNVYCPMILAGINRINDTIEDRSFKIVMKRATVEERTARFHLRMQKGNLQSLREDLELWADRNRDTLTAAYLDLPAEISGLEFCDERFRDIAEPLILIAAHADEETKHSNGLRTDIRSELILALRNLAKERNKGEQREDIGVFAILAKELLGTRERIFIPSVQLLAKTREVEELSGLKSTKALGAFLGRFDLYSRPSSGGKIRGYNITRGWIQEMSRYLPHSKPSHVSQT